MANTKETTLPPIRKVFKTDSNTGLEIAHWIPDLRTYRGRAATEHDRTSQVHGMLDALRGQEDKFLRGIIQGSSKFKTTEGPIDAAGMIGIVLRSLAKSLNLTALALVPWIP